LLIFYSFAFSHKEENLFLQENHFRKHANDFLRIYSLICGRISTWSFILMLLTCNLPCSWIFHTPRDVAIELRNFFWLFHFIFGVLIENKKHKNKQTNKHNGTKLINRKARSNENNIFYILIIRKVAASY
jgi:hypothetical protein